MDHNEISAAWNFSKMVAINIGSVTLSKEDVLAIDDFINRQKAEIERLNKENADREISYMNLYNEMKDRLRDAKEQTNMYKQFWLDSYNEGEMYEARVKARAEARAKAVKEFAERLKSKHRRILDYDEAGFSAPTDIVYVETIDNLVKEFTEGNGGG